MLLFADGFETFNIYDVGRKWGVFEWYDSTGSTAGPPLIVHGNDTTFSPAKQYATNPTGRAMQGRYFKLTTCIKPSRTVFMGFAHRIAQKSTSQSNYVVKIDFLKKFAYDKATYGVTAPSQIFQSLGTVVATCKLVIYPSYIDVTWTFVGTSPLTQTGRINTSSVLDNGDFRYIQLGLTLMGNVVAQPQAWAEVRLGSRGGANNLLHNNIMTAAESGTSASFLINAVSIRAVGSLGNEYFYTSYASHGLDDFYICNDEGEYNNTFLGNVKVRRISVSGDGIDNDSVPYGEAYRFHAVDEDFIDTVNSLPNPLPDPETNPLFIPWETFANDYLTLEERGDRQLMRFNSLNLTGNYSKIHGAILHALMQPKYLDTPATIKAVRKFGITDLVESKPMNAPLIKRAQFEARQFIWENDETIGPGEQYVQWTAAAVDSSEWGFELVPVTIAPESYDPAIARTNLIIYDTIDEAIYFSEVTHRYFEELLAEALAAVDDHGYEYVWALYESLGFNEYSEGNRVGKRFINEVLEFSEYLPYTIMFAGEFIGFAEDIYVQYIDKINEAMDIADWADGFWEELFTDTFEATDWSGASFIMTLEETFGLEEPYLWDGHEDVEETLEINVTYVWDNHELMEEYLYPDDELSHGVGLNAEDGFGIAEEHHDGQWVESFPENACFEDHILTQHWRYETLFGYIISSWQVEPVEQESDDGDHTGDDTWGWGGY